MFISKRAKFTLLAFALPLVITSSCVRYHPKAPKLPQAEHWKTDFEKTEAPHACPQPEKMKYDTLNPWWQVFNDAQLNALQEKAVNNSPTIQLAFYKLQEAKAVYLAERSYLFPVVDLNTVANRSRFSRSNTSSSLQQNSATNVPAATNPLLPTSKRGREISDNGVPTSPNQIPTSSPNIPAAIPASTSAPVTSTATSNPYRTFLQVLPQVSYELDIWGKYAQGAQAAYMNEKEVQEALHTAHLLLTTTLAQNYFQLRAADEDLRILSRVTAIYETQVQLQTDLFYSGLSPETNLLQVKAALAAAQADYEETQNSRQILENSIATLLGESASTFRLEKAAFDPQFPDLRACLPADVLLTRPDVRQSKLNVEEFRLLVGVAKTAFFPDITLSGAAGFQSNRANTLFDWKNRVLSATVAVTENLFAGGKTSADLQAAKARYRQSVANYINTILTAYQEVEDALFAVKARLKQHAFRTEEFKNYKDYATLTQDQYQAGLVTYFFVITADQQALTSARENNTSNLEKVLAHIALIKSLGGSWI